MWGTLLLFLCQLVIPGFSFSFPSCLFILTTITIICVSTGLCFGIVLFCNLTATATSNKVFIWNVFFLKFTYFSKTFCNIFRLILGNYTEVSTITIWACVVVIRITFLCFTLDPLKVCIMIMIVIGITKIIVIRVSTLWKETLFFYYNLG